MEAGAVADGAGVSVVVGDETGVSVGSDVLVGVIGDVVGGVTVLVADWQAASKNIVNRKNCLKPLSSPRLYFKPSNKSVSTFLPPLTRLKAR